LDLYSRIIYTQTKAVWPASARETLVVSTVTPEEGFFSITATSVLHDLVPVGASPVRAKNHYSGWLIRKEADNSCRAWFISYVDPEGSIPKFVLSTMAHQSASNLAGMLTEAEMLEKSGTLPKEVGPADSSSSTGSSSSSSTTSS